MHNCPKTRPLIFPYIQTQASLISADHRRGRHSCARSLTDKRYSVFLSLHSREHAALTLGVYTVLYYVFSCSCEFYQQLLIVVVVNLYFFQLFFNLFNFFIYVLFRVLHFNIINCMCLIYMNYIINVSQLQMSIKNTKLSWRNVTECHRKCDDCRFDPQSDTLLFFLIFSFRCSGRHVPTSKSPT